MTAPTGLAEPPDDLDDFPTADAVDRLHRLSDHPGVWWFSSVPSAEEAGGGRFDLVEPLGTCYFAEHSLEGALVEKLLRTPVKVVVRERLHELYHATITVHDPPHTADLAAAAATGFGVNAEVHTTLAYELPRRWAAALYATGFRALRHLLRGDASGRLTGRAVLGGAGLHRRAPAGMRTHVAPLDVDEAASLLEDRGVPVLPIPRTVPIVSPGDAEA